MVTKRFVVFGAGGFIGKNLCDLLASHKAAVVAFGRTPKPEFSMPGVQWIQGDFQNSGDVQRILKRDDVVVHLVSSSTVNWSNTHILEDLEQNVPPTLHLLEACKNAAVAKIIYVSSGGTVYGIPKGTPIPETAPTEPICAYGISKLAIEKYLALYEKLHGLPSLVLRVSNPYGPYQTSKRHQGVIGQFIQKILQREPLTIYGDGSIIRDYIYVSDVAEAVLAAANYHGSERIFNIGSGLGVTLREVAQSLTESFASPAPINYEPARPSDVPINILSIERAQRELQWQPKVAFADGINKTVKWWQTIRSPQ